MESGASVDRQAILDAALAEVVVRGIDDFSVEQVAARAGVDADAITRLWGDRRVLMLDAQLRGASKQIPVPDTGTLRGDLEILATAMAELAETSHGRRWVHRFMAASGDADLSDVRADFWRVRVEEIGEVLQRAVGRGELREDVDPLEATRMFASTTLFDIAVADTPLRPEYMAQVVDIFVRGINKNP